MIAQGSQKLSVISEHSDVGEEFFDDDKEENDKVRAVDCALSVVVPVIEGVKMKSTHFDASTKCVLPSRRVAEQITNLICPVYLFKRRLESKWPYYRTGQACSTGWVLPRISSTKQDV